MGLRTQNHSSWLQNRDRVPSIALLLPHTHVSRLGSALHQEVALGTQGQWNSQRWECGLRRQMHSLAPAPADAAELAFVTSTTPTHIPTCRP